MTDETRNSLIRREAISEHQGREAALDRNQVEEMHLVLLQGPRARDESPSQSRAWRDFIFGAAGCSLLS